MLRNIVTTIITLLFSLYINLANAVEISANIGFASEYIYRGIPQKNSSASAGFDLDANGFYLGTWGADVGDGIEIDYYGGYGIDVGDFSFSLGGTVYTYTGDFDDTYQEINLGVSWKFLSIDAAIGEYDNFGGPSLDYQFYSITATYNNFYGKAGIFEDDFDSSYYEAGYGNTLNVHETDLFDYSFAIIHSDSTLPGGQSDTNLTLTLMKVFSIR